MDAAAELLSKPATPVGDVARRVGYCHPSHFARAFQRRYGVSPSTFRTESCRAEPHSEAVSQLVLAEQPAEYDSCVGRVRTEPASTSFARVVGL